MKNVLSVICLFILSITISAQEPVKLKLPGASPEAAFTQQLGTTEIKVAYARPLARGRKIFGALVPFDSIWRTGAGDCTTIAFNEELTIGDKKFTAGKYALFSIPTTGDWTIIINTDTTLHGTTGYDAAKDIYRFKVKSTKTDRFYETFTMEVGDINPRGEGFLNLIWENTLVKIPIKSSADENILAEIKKRLTDGNEQNADLMYQAATYYYLTNRDLKQASNWATRAEKLDATMYDYPNLSQKIYADLKDYHAAIDAAKRAVVLAEKKNNTGAVATLNKRISDWQTILGETPTSVASQAPMLSADHASMNMGNMETKPKQESMPNMNHQDHAAMNHSNTEIKSKKESMPNMEMSAQTVDLKTQFAPVLSAYMNLKDALVTDNAVAAAKYGKAMNTALQNIETKNWTAKQRNYYDGFAKKLETDAEHIGDNADKIDHQREHFESLSNNLTSVVKTFKLNADTVYIQYCPMKKASWMSAEKTIKNPYYGKQMLTCGSVTETVQ